MTRLTLADVPVLGPLIQKNIDEYKLHDRLTMDRGLDYVHHLIEKGQGAAFVDDLLEPKATVILFVGEFGILCERFCSISLIYVDKTQRMSRRSLECAQTAEEYARSEKCQVIYGYSWHWKVEQNLESFWKHLGYEKQDVAFVKTLKPL